MTITSFEIEQDSLEAAEQQAQSRRPAGRHLFSKEVLSDGQEKSVQAQGETVPDAVGKAKEQVPSGAQVLREHIVLQPFTKMMEVRAADEKEAQEKLRKKTHYTATVGPARMIKPAGPRFLGIPISLPLFQAEVKQLAKAEVFYKIRPRLRITIEEFPEKGFCQVCGKSGAGLDELKIDPVRIGGTLFKFKTQGYFTCSATCLTLAMAADQVDLDDEMKKLRGGMMAQAALSGNRSAVSRLMQDAASEYPNVARRKSEASKMPQRHCWSCGVANSLKAEKCTACGHTLRLF